MLEELDELCIWYGLFTLLMKMRILLVTVYVLSLQTYANCGDPAHLAHVLQFEDVLIELIQLDEDYTRDGTVLAFYQVSTRDFLYPEDSLLPRYAETDREVLMHKKIWFTVSMFKIFRNKEVE